MPVNTFGQPIKLKDENGDTVGERIPVVSRQTKEPLGGSFGSDKHRRLIVSFKAGDIIAFRPAGTRREITATAASLYATVIRWQVNKLNLLRAVEAKAKKKEQRERAAIARADRKLRLAAKALKAKGGQ
jgi:hypothetical protein